MPTLTKAAIEHIKKSEGLRLTAYPDPGSKDGKPVTIGYGTTRINGKPISLGTKITKEQAEQYLEADLKVFATKVAALIKVKLSDNQFGALVSFAYNIGIDAFAKSTLLRLLNAGDYKSVPTQLRRWNKNDGEVMQGLINRREAEVVLWNGKAIATTEKPTGGSKPTVPNKGSSNSPNGFLELLIEFILKLFKRT